jgi:phosphatidylserine/phosphatidylglycerophosphate/cardiolipin synthase-like enzyme
MDMELSLLLPPIGQSLFRESHAYGPTESSFYSNLEMEIDPAAGPNAPLLAVAEGGARWHPDPAPATTGTLLLSPSLKTLRALVPIVGASNVVFVYRNLERESSRPYFTPRIAAVPPFFEGEPLTSRVRRFLEGDYSVWVKSGDKLALSGGGGAKGWSRFGFEIVFVLTKTLDQFGHARMLEWISPQQTTRRLDPAAFFRMLANASAGAKLRSADANHPFFQLVTRRTLLELRDEYDQPFVGSASVKTGQGEASKVYTFTAGNRGTVVLSSASPGTPVMPTKELYEVGLANHVFTELPVGYASLTAPQQSLAAPAHWALQALFLPPASSTEEEPQSWFVANTAPLPRYRKGNAITPIIDGLNVFREFTRAMRMVKQQGHFLYLANWWLDDSFELVHGDSNSTVLQLLRVAVFNNGIVRALAWDQAFSQQNDDAVQHINALFNGEAILDDDTLDVSGTHHQKILIVNGSHGAYAFCGGIDINTDRRDSSNHGAIGGFHDVHAKIEGPAAADIHRSFVDRWNSHSKNNPLSLTPPALAEVGSVYVQVARTYAPRKKYSFAPKGSLTPLDAIIRAIKKAKKFIYIEDQYLTPFPGDHPAYWSEDTLGVLNALREALLVIDYLLIVIPNHADVGWLQKFVGSWSPGQLRYRRRKFIEGLVAAAPSVKVHVFYLGRDHTAPGPGELATEGGGLSSSSGGEKHRDEIYVHSKVWIVDDVCAKIGSANCNRRSYTHDSEMDVVMLDGAVDRGARSLAKKLRLDLWSEHLGLSKEERPQLEDHKLALNFWLRGPQPFNSRVRIYRHEEDADQSHTGWDSVDPEGRW